MDGITKNVIKELRPLAELAKDALRSHIRPLAEKTAALLDECSSEDEFRLRCAAANEDPEEKFKSYAQYVYFARGYYSLGVAGTLPRLSDWWAFERIPGAHKPDPWLTGYVDSLR